MKRFSSDPPVSEELAYWEFESTPFGHLILTDGSLVGALEVTLKDIECLDNDGINKLTLGLRGLLNSAPEGASLQFMLSVRSDFEDTIARHESKVATGVHPLIKDLSESRIVELRRAASGHELYRPHLFVYVRIPRLKARTSGFFATEKEFQNVTRESHEEHLEILSDALEGIKSSLSALGMDSKPMDRSPLIREAYSFLNPKRSRVEPTPLVRGPVAQLPSELVDDNPWLKEGSPREQLTFGDLILGYESFVLDGYSHKVITLKTLPEFTASGQLSEILRLPFHYDLILTFHIPPQDAEMASLERRRRMAHSLAANTGGGVSDLQSETKLSSTEELIRELLTTGQRIFASQLQFVLRAPADHQGQKSLVRQAREVLSRLRGLQGAEGLEESVGAWKVLKGNLPGAPMHLERAKKIKTNNLADFLPVYGPREGDEDPVVIFRNRLNGLFSFNAFSSLPNFNTLVTGSSGAGKSFLNNCILLQEFARNQRVFIIDIGGSYKKLTHALGGQYLEINLSESHRINPLHLEPGQKEPTDQKLKTLVACIESMVADDEKGRLPKIERVLLEKEIVELYSKFNGREAPVLSDLASALQSSTESSMRELSKMLYTWTGTRPYGRLVDGAGGLTAKARICTFDLKGLSSYPDLQRVMILILTDFILTQVESDRSVKKRIILDEAWQLLRSSSAADFMEYCARTLRKTGSGITFITQGVEEIAASPIGPAILNNTATKFVMLQRGDMNILAKNLKLNAREIELIASLGQKKGHYSEGFLIKGDDRQIVRVFPTPLEYWLATSDAEDNGYLDSLVAQGIDLQSAIKRASEEYPNGMSQRKEGS